MLDHVQALIDTIDTLRSPGGCPWDRKQTLASATHHLQDEAAEVLDAAGYKYPMPEGAFYFFVQAPGGDDVAFASKLQENLILAVPGSGFGAPGHFRLTFCVDEKVIRNAADGFKAAIS